MLLLPYYWRWCEIATQHPEKNINTLHIGHESTGKCLQQKQNQLVRLVIIAHFYLVVLFFVLFLVVVVATIGVPQSITHSLPGSKGLGVPGIFLLKDPRSLCKVPHKLGMMRTIRPGHNLWTQRMPNLTKNQAATRVPVAWETLPWRIND